MLFELREGRPAPGAGLRLRFLRPMKWGLLVLVAMLLAIAPESQGWDGAEPAAKKSAPPLQGSRRVREGTELVDQVGRFEVVGDRVVFVTDRGSVRLVGLENLGLERIARTLANDPGPLEWKVTGTVTEYRGTNFVLIRRAILKAAGERREGTAFPAKD
jgi:hypothetical protein